MTENPEKLQKTQITRSAGTMHFKRRWTDKNRAKTLIQSRHDPVPFESVLE
jgi:hypothetical protein